MPESILASTHSEVVLADVTPLPACGVSRPTVALDYVITIQVCGPITLTVTQGQGDWSRCSHRYQALAQDTGYKESGQDHEGWFGHHG